MTTFVARPPRFAGVLAALAGAVGVGFAAFGGVTALAVAALGLPLLAAGAFRGRGDLAATGGLLVVAGALASGVSGAPTVTVVAATAAAFVAWDVAEYGVDLGEQVGVHARSRNAILVHAAASTIVAAVTTVLAVALFTVGPSGRPFSALLLLLVGAVVIAVVFSD